MSNKARTSIKSRILEDELQHEYVIIDGKKAAIMDSPRDHSDTNILGLMMCSRLGLCLNDKHEFRFADAPKYF